MMKVMGIQEQRQCNVLYMHTSRSWNRVLTPIAASLASRMEAVSPTYLQQHNKRKADSEVCDVPEKRYVLPELDLSEDTTETSLPRLF